MTFTIRMDQCPDGSWGVLVANLPGCYSWGETREAAARYVVEAIEGVIEVGREFGRGLPDWVMNASPDEPIEIIVGPDLTLEEVLNDSI
ncbi:MAG: type II toxin-antitoxin system HicB family antitoxin [Candidatus Eremiobacteraeota bacterium]|nr:type II toxin-antitoxin system HicB family antitoxin [Candidatus Eremiobacteraeota bacterium]